MTLATLLNQWPLNVVGTEDEIDGADLVGWLPELKAALTEARAERDRLRAACASLKAYAWSIDPDTLPLGLRAVVNQACDALANTTAPAPQGVNADLLAALKDLLPHVGVGYSGIQRHGILEKARAAIAKAEGR